MQFNHKPTKMLLTDKKGVSQNDQTAETCLEKKTHFTYPNIKVNDIKIWMTNHLSKLNDDKTEFNSIATSTRKTL